MSTQYVQPRKVVPPGTFHGEQPAPPRPVLEEIPPGTFHGEQPNPPRPVPEEIPPGTFH